MQERERGKEGGRKGSEGGLGEGMERRLGMSV